MVGESGRVGDVRARDVRELVQVGDCAPVGQHAPRRSCDKSASQTEPARAFVGADGDLPRVVVVTLQSDPREVAVVVVERDEHGGTERAEPLGDPRIVVRHPEAEVVERCGRHGRAERDLEEVPTEAGLEHGSQGFEVGGVGAQRVERVLGDRDHRAARSAQPGERSGHAVPARSRAGRTRGDDDRCARRPLAELVLEMGLEKGMECSRRHGGAVSLAVTRDPGLERLTHLNLAEFGRESARWSGPRGEIHEAAGVVHIATATTFPVLCNGALRLDASVDADDLVDRATEWFDERSRGFSVWTRPGPDDDLVAVLVARGFHGTPPGAPEMICRQPLDPPAPDASTELRWVDDEAGARDFVAVNADAYSTYGIPREVLADILVDVDAFLAPHLHHVVAYVDGAPAAAAQVLLSHGIGGVYWVGTTEAARGRGLGEAVTRAVTNRAFERGASVVSLQASAMGEPIYRRLGYEELHRYVVYVRWPESQ